MANNGGLLTEKPAVMKNPERSIRMAKPERKVMQRAQFTLQQLQDFTERQSKQIFYNSQEMTEKQNKLMKLHNDLQYRKKLQNGSQAEPKGPRSPRLEHHVSPRNLKVSNKPEKEQYAMMLRQTYQNMGKLHNRNHVSQEINLKRFSTSELGDELTKVRSIFAAKQNELAEAVKKVDVLTQQLESRRNSESNHSSVPTPERINRRKKIQAAKDELDRLRNELIVRNEMNSQQSHQLQLQRDIIHEKKAELRELNTRMNELGNALKKQNHASSRNKADHSNLFNGSYLYDTLNRRSNTQKDELFPPPRKFEINNNNKPSPSSSTSSLSSISTPDETKTFTFNNRESPQPPVRTTPVGVLINHAPVINNSEQFSTLLAKQKEKVTQLQKQLDSASNSYTDSKLSSDSDELVDRYKDVPVKNQPAVKSKPVVPAKPTLSVKPIMENKDDEAENNMAYIVKPLSESIFANERKGPSEPEEFELSFADIDEINETQSDLWESSATQSSSFDSETDDLENIPVPVIISVSPDKMPPPILMKPGKQRKPKRNLVLDPFALLLDSALEGEMDVVKETLKQVPDPSRANPEGITALHNAVCGNHKDVVRFLVEVACDVNAADNNGWTPLHCAAFYNDTELCRFLVEHGASVFATTYTDYQTPAHKCSQLDENYDECFGYLHECKENVGRVQGGLVHALFDYKAENEDELSFYCGETVNILRRGDNTEKEWWWGRNNNDHTGYVPCNLIGNFPRIAAEV